MSPKGTSDSHGRNCKHWFLPFPLLFLICEFILVGLMLLLCFILDSLRYSLKAYLSLMHECSHDKCKMRCNTRLHQSCCQTLTQRQTIQAEFIQSFPNTAMYVHAVTLCESKTHKFYFKLFSSQHTFCY